MKWNKELKLCVSGVEYPTVSLDEDDEGAAADDSRSDNQLLLSPPLRAEFYPAAAAADPLHPTFAVLEMGQAVYIEQQPAAYQEVGEEQQEQEENYASQPHEMAQESWAWLGVARSGLFEAK